MHLSKNLAVFRAVLCRSINFCTMFEKADQRFLRSKHFEINGFRQKKQRRKAT